MALKFVVDVERIGDLAAGIAKRALELNRLPTLDGAAISPRLASLVQKNLHVAIDSFVKRRRRRGRGRHHTPTRRSTG